MVSNWMMQAREHWKEHLPKRYAELKKAGTLEKTLKYAVEQTHREMSQLEEAGLNHHEAWEIVREQYLFLKGEPEPESDEPSPFHEIFSGIHQLQSEIGRAIDNRHEFEDENEQT